MVARAAAWKQHRKQVAAAAAYLDGLEPFCVFFLVYLTFVGMSEMLPLLLGVLASSISVFVVTADRASAAWFAFVGPLAQMTAAATCLARAAAHKFILSVSCSILAKVQHGCWATVLHGHLLGLRRLVMRHAFFRGDAAAGALQYIFTLEERLSVPVDLEHFNAISGEVGHNIASSLTEGIGDQASGRVDVPGGVPQPVAALHERLGHSGGQETNFLYQDENCKFPVFLRSLDGRTKELQVHGSEKVSKVKQRISESMRVPGDCFYLTLNSRLLDEDALIVESGISRDVQISVCRRLRGGATYGEWVCSFCKRGGCWASKPFCFRCGQPRQSIPAGMGFPPNGYKGNFREQQHMGRKPTPQTMGDPSIRGASVWACSMCCGAKKASCQAEQC